MLTQFDDRHHAADLRVTIFKRLHGFDSESRECVEKHDAEDDAPIARIARR